MKQALLGILVLLVLVIATAVTLYVEITGLRSPSPDTSSSSDSPPTAAAPPPASSVAPANTLTIPPSSLTHMFVWGPLSPEMRATRDSALKTNPDLMAEHKQIMDDLQANEVQIEADMAQADPKVAPTLAKIDELRKSAATARSSTTGTNVPTNQPAAPALTPEEIQEIHTARAAAMQAHPERIAEQQKLKWRMVAFADKLYDAMVKIDPSLSSKAPLPPAGNFQPPATIPPSYAPLDMDAMAARMKKHQDIYQRIRDESSDVYCKTQNKTSIDDDTKTTIRLWAYLTVWGDFYGEGLWGKGNSCGLNAMVNAPQDPMAYTFVDVEELQFAHSDSENHAQRIFGGTETFLASDYPIELKLNACTCAIGNLIKYKRYEHPDANADSLKKMPVLIQQWGDNYRKLIQGNPPHDFLYQVANDLFCVVQYDENSLNSAIAEVDRDFNETDASNPVKIALDGQYFVQAAWCARGTDWANNVTDEGWKLFAERLSKADEILEAGFAKYPSEGEMAVSMLSVELGQGQGRDRMEDWFQKAIKVDPDDYWAYKSKEWYLQPRWYGSVDDIISFGQECIKTDNWSANIPIIFNIGIAEAAQQDPSLYSRDDIWPIIEKNYRAYLDHFPRSTHYRTGFAKHAYDSGHLDIAAEQFKLLGNDWDRGVLSESDYASIAQKLGLK